MTLLARSLVVLVALALVAGMGVHYESQEEAHWPYPDADSLAADYDSHVGQETFLFGTVESVDQSAQRVVVSVSTNAEPMELTVTGSAPQVQPGGVVQVYGTIEPDRQIAARNVAVVNPAGSSTLFKYGISLVGVAVFLVAFFRQWRFDPETYSFEARYDG